MGAGTNIKKCMVLAFPNKVDHFEKYVSDHSQINLKQ